MLLGIQSRVTASRNRSVRGPTQALWARQAVNRDDHCADSCAVAAVYNNVLQKRGNLQIIHVKEILNIRITLDNKLIFISCHTK